MMDRRTFAVANLGLAATLAGAAKASTFGRFSHGFQWGVATAAHQTEGNNVNSDFWLMEHLKPTPFVEPSGDACDSYHRYADDIAIVAKLGLTTYRYSIEWARIEPVPGSYSQAELDHYRRMAETCRKHGVRPLATYHHFTSPRWLAAMGGWTHPSTPDRFAAYADKVTRAIGDVLDGVCTINEPNGSVEDWALRGGKPIPGVDAFAALAAKVADAPSFSTNGLKGIARNSASSLLIARLSNAR